MPEWEYHIWTDEDNLALVEQICLDDIEEYINFPNGAIRADVRDISTCTGMEVYILIQIPFYRHINGDLLSPVCILGIEEEMPELGDSPKLGNGFRLLSAVT
jgi:hypothetical protein